MMTQLLTISNARYNTAQKTESAESKEWMWFWRNLHANMMFWTLLKDSGFSVGWWTAGSRRGTVPDNNNNHDISTIKQ